MRLPLGLTLLLAALLLNAAIGLAAQPRELFVSPRGDDSWEGTRDRPFATLARARDALRQLRGGGALPVGGVTVYLRAGVYPLTETFALTQEDSGAPGAPITYRAYQSEEVRLTGGLRLTDFAPVADADVLARLPVEARGHVLQADLKARGLTDFGALSSRGFARPTTPAHLELFFQNRRMTLARWPNDGYAYIAGIPQGAGSPDDHGGEIGRLDAGFLYEGDRPKRWRETDDIWVHGFWAWDWANTYERVASLDTDARLVKTHPPHGMYGFRPGQRFYFLNLLEELDQPGEYYVDRETGLLYFWPPAPLAEGEAWVSLLAAPFVSLQDVSHVAFRTLTFECARGNAIEISGGDHDLVADCTLRSLGNWAVIINDGSEHGVQGCDIYGLGDGGIQLNGGDRKTLTPAGHYAVDNHLHHLAEWSRCYQPAVAVNGVGNRVAHNLIHDHPHAAIILGGNEHLIEFNDIHHVCLDAGDVGAFYMGRDWTQRGNIVRHNFFHHTGGLGMGSMAVYLDDCTSGTTVFGNVFYQVSRAVFVGGGRDNIVENNIFVDCRPAVAVDGRGLDSSPVWHGMVYDYMKARLEEMNYHQPPYRDRYPKLLDLDRYYAGDEGVPPEGNVILRNISVGGQWLEIGWHAEPSMMDIRDNLVDQDPLFVDPARLNFQLRDDSTAYSLGFQRLPFDQIGPQPDRPRP